MDNITLPVPSPIAPATIRSCRRLIATHPEAADMDRYTLDLLAFDCADITTESADLSAVDAFNVWIGRIGAGNLDSYARTIRVASEHAPRFLLVECGHLARVDGFTTGYGYNTHPSDDPNTARACFACCQAAEVAQLADPLHTVHTAYLSADGQRITGWPGGELMRVIRWSEARTGFQRSTVRSVWAKTPDGRTWYGKGAGTGMVITLRALKGGR